MPQNIILNQFFFLECLQCIRVREGKQSWPTLKNGPHLLTSIITLCSSQLHPFSSHPIFRDISVREALRSVLVVQHKIFIDFLFGRSTPKPHPDGQLFGKSRSVLPLRPLRSAFRFCYPQRQHLAPRHRIYQHTGIWWKEQKIKQGSSIKFFHPAPIHKGKHFIFSF